MDIKKFPQPLGFFHVITNTDALHYGYWPKENEKLDLCQAQLAHSQLLLNRFPKPPAKILDVGCGLGLMAGELHQLGYQVTAIAPSESLINYAQERHAGPDYINCGFLDDHPTLREGKFDVLLFQESLQYFPDLAAVFSKAGKLLTGKGRLILCDEVSYNERTRPRSAVHTVRAIEQAFFAQGFFVQHHQTMGAQVTPTCKLVLEGLEQKKQQMISIFGQQAKAQLEHLIVEWRNLQDWYQNHVFGYELWELRVSPYRIRGYREQDELIIIEQFNRVFQKNRSLEHWRWKYLHNPQGGPCVSMAWDGDQMVSHYSAYPLPLTVDGRATRTYHVGDTFTVPAWREVGRGKTNLLSRVVRLFYKSWFEGQVDFPYGFNTGKIQALGKQFLSYIPIVPVYEYHYSHERHSLNKHLKILRLLKGYRIEIALQSGDWADTLFAQAKNDYSILISRNREYLQWRYDQHPDFDYHYVLLKHFGNVVGWWVIRKTDSKLLLIDAFSTKQHSGQLVKCVQEVLRHETACSEMSGWFADTPGWWCEQLRNHGFSKKRQPQSLDLCANFFSARFTKNDLAEKFYFTMGDSDLY